MFCQGFIIGMASLILLTGSPANQSKQVRAALLRLDKLMTEEESLDAEKTARISALRNQLEKAGTDQMRFNLQKCLYEEYSKYDLDSALRYVHLEEETARRIGDRILINEALNDKADRYVLSGMYRYAQAALEQMQIEPTDAPRAQASYYRTLITLHHGLKLTNKDPMFNEELDRLEHEYRNMIFDAADSTILYFYTYQAENELDRGRPDKARDILKKYLDMNPTDEDELSILHYCIGKTYTAEGDIDNALINNAISSSYDLRNVVRSSRSLIKTARMAMQLGYTERAFSYITRAYNNATVADARVCLEEISAFMPEVISSYDKVSKQRYNGILIIMMLLALLLTASIIILLVIRQYQMRLKHSLVRIKEANELREATLGQYAAMFASHINSLEEYRSSIRVVAKSKDLDVITQALRSDDFIDAKRETLLKEFDKTFLSVFPDFVQQLNALLKEDQQIGKSLPQGKLSNELRIFALIRLGVTESADISRFLKKSPSTIYNYRVKLRNASIYPNEEFEKRLMEIGKA